MTDENPVAPATLGATLDALGGDMSVTETTLAVSVPVTDVVATGEAVVAETESSAHILVTDIEAALAASEHDIVGQVHALWAALKGLVAEAKAAI